MIRLIRYVIYFLLIMLCLFWLQRHGGGVRAGFDRMASSTKAFFLDVGKAPKGDRDAIYKQISGQDFIGGLGATTTSSTPKNTIKGYDSLDVKKIPAEPAALTVDGIVRYTNMERQKAGLPPVTIHRKLSASALKKANDMLDRQYFEHTSPDGRTAVNLIKDQGYVYQIVGENLALGDFGSDAKLVDAWMNSPAHRANILNGKFSEVGIGIVKGNYNGSIVWLAVQHFGKPVPVCPVVSQNEKRAIDAERFQLEGEEQELQLMAKEIESDPEQDKGKEFLDAYNARVIAYNGRLTLLRAKIAQYNQNVSAYNVCVGAETI